MTEKEFHKLRRRDLLQLLVAQGKENLQLQAEFDETSAQLQQTRDTNERLKARLNEKDALIDKLKGRLDQKDARIKKLREDMEAWKTSRQIQLVEAGSIAEAALRLNGIFETAQKAADQYLYNLRVQCGLEKGEDPLELEAEDDGDDAELARALEADRRAEMSWSGETVQEAGETQNAGESRETPEGEEVSLSGKTAEAEDASWNGENAAVQESSLNGETPKAQDASLNGKNPETENTAEPEGGRRAEAFS